MTFPLEDIVQHPLPGLENLPGSIAFSPDDRLITFLQSPDGTLSRKLYAFDTATGEINVLANPPGGGVKESNLSMAEKLRRERLRERGLGVTRFAWSTRGGRLLVPLPTGIYVQDAADQELRLVQPAQGALGPIDPQLSPDGSEVAYVLDDEVWVAPAGPGAAAPPRQVTSGAKESGVCHGIAEYIAQEEMDRRTGFKWSLDGRHIAFASVDSSGVPLFRIMHPGKDSTGPEAQEDHAYPFAGAANVRVRLGVAPASGSGGAVWMDLDCGGVGNQSGDEYLARFHWTPAGALLAEVQNRAQTLHKVLQFDIATGACTELWRETNGTWINIHDMLRPLTGAQAAGAAVGGGVGGPGLAGCYLWASERTGFLHLYLRDGAGAELCQLTAGDWMVDSLEGVDEAGGWVYLMGTFDGPRECHLYRVPLPPSAEAARQGWPPAERPERITRGAGRHSVFLDHGLRRYVDIFDSLGSPPRVALCVLEPDPAGEAGPAPAAGGAAGVAGAGGGELRVVYQPSWPNPRAERLGLTAPELVETTAGDGGTRLYGALYKPDPAVFGPGPYKTVVSVYGGPHVQTVVRSWIMNIDMRAQYLRSKGFLVWKLDNRGSSRRGLAFEGAVRWRMGDPDADDQAAGVRWLVSQGLADPARVAIYGWSYGGYLSAMSLARFPSVFKAAVAGAPVSSWDGYDTHYTERYMGTPQENQEGYETSSVMTHAGKIGGRIMLVHGMIDENVHFRHTARLINALTAHEKHYELLLFPEERHMPRGLRDRIYMEGRIFAFLDSCLA